MNEEVMRSSIFLKGIVHDAMRRLPVSSSSSTFLSVSFKTFWDLKVNDKPHIGFVDAQCKCDGRNNDVSLSIHPAVLDCHLILWVHVCMEELCLDSF